MLNGKWTPALLLTLTFLLGLCLGFIIRDPLMGPFRGFQPRGGPDGMLPPPLFDQMADELALTSEQQDELDRILEENRLKLQALRRDVLQPQTRAVSDSTRAAVEALLTPEQMQKYREFRRRMRPGRPGPGQWRPPFER